ncbi:MAG: 50S ribosomal protein L35ae [Nanoarchaeota archaeon]|nr:50S ribosomal protein L35ae [Nanoarchaeota archaeon]
MEGVIVNFRMGRHTYTGNQMVVKVKGVASKDKAKALVGKAVTWTNTKENTITGKVASAHGNSGNVRVLFEKGMPGQAIGSKVKVA